MKNGSFVVATIVACLFNAMLFADASAAEKKQKPVRVFILAGQSNMEGKGATRHLTNLINDPKTSADFKHLKDPDGKWVVRDDVWVWFLNKKGNLTVGFGSGDRIGPELGFGWQMGEHFDEQVLLIKTAWGGHDLEEKFLPPSSGGPGPSYTAMVKNVKDVLSNLKENFPDYQGQGYEITGFVWFQGFNDRIDKKQQAEHFLPYAERLANLIRDLRKDLKAPNMPVVIGELGGAKEPGDFQKAQASVAELPEFKGTVAFVETHQFVQPIAIKAKSYIHTYKLCKNAARKARLAKDEAALAVAWDDWNKIKPEFEKFASDAGYHYYGSGEFFYRTGDAFGKAMLKLLESKGSP